MKNFCERLRELREDKDMRQEDVALKLGLKQRTYSNYEMGVTEPKIKTIIAIAQYYGISVDYLLGQTNDPVPYMKTR